MPLFCYIECDLGYIKAFVGMMHVMEAAWSRALFLSMSGPLLWLVVRAIAMAI